MAKLRVDRRKLNRILNTPITVRDLVAFVVALVVLGIAMLVMGASPMKAHTPKFVARAASLNPAPIVTTPSEPVVKQTVVDSTDGSSAAPNAAVSASGASKGVVTGGNNCVVCVLSYTGRSQAGNAGTWRATSSTPAVGKIMIFRPGQQGAGRAGHVGLVVGVHGNMVSLKHCNWPGQTEFYSTGLFY